MKNSVIIVIILVLLNSCGSEGNGELVGVEDRSEWFEAIPHGMLFIPMGSFNMGPSDQDVASAITSQTKTVSIDPFWMDETEITNNEYRQFVYWVRDSLARRLLAETLEEFLLPDPEDGEAPDPPLLNWEEEIRWQDSPEQIQILEDGNLFLRKEERFWNRKEIDAHQLNYQYWWIDLKQAAKKSNRYDFKTKKYTGQVIDNEGNKVDIEDRSSFIMTGNVNIYPDTLVWMADYTYSYNEPWTKMYFWHPAFDEYPVVGVTWVQANAFCIWRTQFMNDWLLSNSENLVQDYRLPTEAEYWILGINSPLLQYRIF
jgi:formylglycine-generating enzyme required for sulfatase activity